MELIKGRLVTTLHKPKPISEIIMWKTLLATAALCLAVKPAVACDDHIGTCKVEDLTHVYIPSLQAIQIDGVATCNAGQIRLRLYDGEGDARKFIGVETAFIGGHIFTAIKLPTRKPSALSVKYSIDPE